MSSGNYFETRRKAFKLRTKNITTSASLTAYTTRVGGPSNDFIEDRVIKITTTAGNSITITVSDGIYEGQKVLIIFQAEGSNETVTVTPTTGSATNLTATPGYTLLEWSNVTTGWVEIKASAT